jgi:hypothetical protein
METDIFPVSYWEHIDYHFIDDAEIIKVLNRFPNNKKVVKQVLATGNLNTSTLLVARLPAVEVTDLLDAMQRFVKQYPKTGNPPYKEQTYIKALPFFLYKYHKEKLDFHMLITYNIKIADLPEELINQMLEIDY